MKKIVAIILAVMMSLCFASCGEKKSNASLEDQYLAVAQKCIDNGENDKAIEVLKQGIEKTKSEKLQQMLDSISVSNTTDAPTTTEISTTTAIPTTIPATTTPPPVTTEASSKFVGTWQNHSEYGTTSVYIKYTGGDEYSIHIVFLDGEDDFVGTLNGDDLEYDQYGTISYFELESDYTMSWYDTYNRCITYMQRVS